MNLHPIVGFWLELCDCNFIASKVKTWSGIVQQVMFVQSKLETDSNEYYRPKRLPRAGHSLKTKTILICVVIFHDFKSQCGILACTLKYVRLKLYCLEFRNTERYCSTRQVMFVQSKHFNMLVCSQIDRWSMLRQCPRISILAWENKCRFRVHIFFMIIFVFVESLWFFLAREKKSKMADSKKLRFSTNRNLNAFLQKFQELVLGLVGLIDVTQLIWL